MEQRRRNGEVGDGQRVVDQVFVLAQMCVEHFGFFVEAFDRLGNSGLIRRAEIDEFLHQVLESQGPAGLRAPMREYPSLPARDIGAAARIIRPQGRGCLLAIYCMIAQDSQSVKSPSTKVGVRPVGLSAR